METRKIIGYKAPMDLFDGKVKQGNLFYHNSADGYIGTDGTKIGKASTIAGTFLPKEIVETWTPVFEEEYKAGDLVFVNPHSDSSRHTHSTSSLYLERNVVKISDLNLNDRYFLPEEDMGGGGIWFDEVRKATPEEIKEYKTFKSGDYVIWTEDYDPEGKIWFRKGDIVKLTVDQYGNGNVSMNHNIHGIGSFQNKGKFRKATSEEIKSLNKVQIEGYDLNVWSDKTGVNFGCQNFTKQELETYKDFLQRNAFSAKMYVNSIEITVEMIDKILNKLT